MVVLTFSLNLLIRQVGALVVWRADLYRKEADRQLGDTSFYCRVDGDLTSHHQSIVFTTIPNFISDRDLPPTSQNLLTTTPRTPAIYFLPTNSPDEGP